MGVRSAQGQHTRKEGKHSRRNDVRTNPRKRGKYSKKKKRCKENTSTGESVQQSNQRETKKRSTGPSRVVPHRSTTPARTCLTSLVGWEVVSQADVAALSVQPDPASATGPARGIDSRLVVVLLYTFFLFLFSLLGRGRSLLPFLSMSFPSVSLRHKDSTRKREKQERKDIVEEKSAAPGLPAWSPTAVLPRLEPA